MAIPAYMWLKDDKPAGCIILAPSIRRLIKDSSEHLEVIR